MEGHLYIHRSWVIILFSDSKIRYLFGGCSTLRLTWGLWCLVKYSFWMVQSEPSTLCTCYIPSHRMLIINAFIYTFLHSLLLSIHSFPLINHIIYSLCWLRNMKVICLFFFCLHSYSRKKSFTHSGHYESTTPLHLHWPRIQAKLFHICFTINWAVKRFNINCGPD